MSALPSWIYKTINRGYEQEQESILEEQRKIREKAENYDKLVNLVGYHEFIDVMKEKINAEIQEATKDPLEAEKSRLHVLRWNAMREVMDAALNDVIETRKERDRIKQEEFEFLRQKHMQSQEDYVRNLE